MKNSLGLLLLLTFLLVSCKSTDNITYFQDVDNLNKIMAAGTSAYCEPKILEDDMLLITVSANDPEAATMFNLPLISYTAPGDTEVSKNPVLQSYIVDSSGYINFPVLGKLHVTGNSCDELTKILEEKLKEYIKSPLVNVRIVNFKISVLGEVNTPGSFPLSTPRVSILDALSLAGDLTIHGERTNLLLIRDQNGKKDVYRIDLTSSELLASPYFYLQQNDVLYVKPNKARRNNAKYSPSSQYNISVVSTIISALSIILVLFIK